MNNGSQKPQADPSHKKSKNEIFNFASNIARTHSPYSITDKSPVEVKNSQINFYPSKGKVLVSGMDQLQDPTPKTGAHGGPTTPVQFMGRASLTPSNKVQVPVKIFFGLKMKSL